MLSQRKKTAKNIQILIEGNAEVIFDYAKHNRSEEWHFFEELGRVYKLGLKLCSGTSSLNSFLSRLSPPTSLGPFTARYFSYPIETSSAFEPLDIIFSFSLHSSVEIIQLKNLVLEVF